MGGCASKNKFEDDGDNISLSIRPITVETETWKRDSHGLFDYESNDVVKNSLKIIGSAQLYRDNDHIEQTTNKYANSRRADVVLDVSFESRNNTLSDREEMEEEKFHNLGQTVVEHGGSNGEDACKSQTKTLTNTPIAQLLYKHGNYWIYNKLYYDRDEDFTSNPESQIWYSIRDYRESASSFGYSLKENDILRFGRARLKVVKIHIPKLMNKASECKLKLSEKVKQCELNSLDVVQSENETDNGTEVSTCRICFTEGDGGNPLISLCKCSGSMKFIHLECLKGWINSKKTVKSTNQAITYTWKAYEWELCKSSYSEALQAKYGLLIYENPFVEYIIFEGINLNNSKSIYIINLDSDREMIKIGRGQDNEIRISDISVSRFHAQITREKDRFVLKDNNSKFGTLACLKKPLCLTNYSSIHLQIGRTLMQVSMREKKDWSLNGCLWLNNDNTVVKAKKSNGLLWTTEVSDDMIPREFK